MSMSIEEIDERARQMSDDDREAYLVARKWENAGVGWFPPGGTEVQLPGGSIRTNLTGGGLYSLSTAIREQLARECLDSTPNELGRHYHGSEPAGSFGQRW
jgi:hypothetical protein